MTAYYATTRFYQNVQEFECTWDLSATPESPSKEEAITHLSIILEENYAEIWGRDEEEIQALDLHGLSPVELARELVLNEKESTNRYGVTWEISTRWEETDPDNWEHPGNL